MLVRPFAAHWTEPMRRWGLPLATIALIAVAAPTAAASQWRLQTLPSVAGQTAGELAAVSCASASDCLGAGTYAGARGTDHNLAERWNGVSWSLRTTPNPRHDAGFSGVSCPAASSCTAVGGSSSLWADRLSDSTWRFGRMASVSGPVRWLHAVSCSSATACMAVGVSGPEAINSRPLAERWTGTRWRHEPVPLPSGSFGGELKGVSCTGQGACLAVGDYADAHGERALAERWDGRHWTSLRPPDPTGDSIELNAVSCAGKSWCEAVGDYSRSSQGTFYGLAEHWNGSRWRREWVAGPAGRAKMFGLEGVSCAARGSCSAVGDSADRQLRGYVLAEHRSAGGWSVQPTQDPPGFGGTLFGVSCTRGGACMAVGWQQRGEVFGAQLQFAERYS